MDCRKIKALIPDYVAHTATKEDIQKVEEHLCVCQECRDYLSEYLDKRALTEEKEVSPQETVATSAEGPAPGGSGAESVPLTGKEPLQAPESESTEDASISGVSSQDDSEKEKEAATEKEEPLGAVQKPQEVQAEGEHKAEALAGEPGPQAAHEEKPKEDTSAPAPPQEEGVSAEPYSADIRDLSQIKETESFEEPQGASAASEADDKVPPLEQPKEPAEEEPVEPKESTPPEPVEPPAQKEETPSPPQEEQPPAVTPQEEKTAPSPPETETFGRGLGENEPATFADIGEPNSFTLNEGDTNKVPQPDSDETGAQLPEKEALPLKKPPSEEKAEEVQPAPQQADTRLFKDEDSGRRRFRLHGEEEGVVPEPPPSEIEQKKEESVAVPEQEPEPEPPPVEKEKTVSGEEPAASLAAPETNIPPTPESVSGAPSPIPEDTLESAAKMPKEGPLLSPAKRSPFAGFDIFTLVALGAGIVIALAVISLFLKSR